MKAVYISSKTYKKQLLISHNEVAKLHVFLRRIIKSEVLIINTNLGIEVYYLSSFNCTNTIINSFLITLSKKNKTQNNFRIFSVINQEEFTKTMDASFFKLATMPLFFTSYTKSALHQINLSYSENIQIIKSLFILWQNSLLTILSSKKSSKKTRVFLITLQIIYIETKHNSALKKLLKDVLNTLKSN